MPDSKKGCIYKFSGKKSSTYLTRNETLQLNGKTQLKVEEVTQNAKELFKELIDKPEELLKYIESRGTPVIRAPRIDRFLALIGELEGFILPLSGVKAFLLTVIINTLSPVKVKSGFNTPAMFVMRNKPANIYYLAHQFYHWLSYVDGLPGYDEDINTSFRHVLSSDFNSNDIKSMTIDQILSLKDAIARDNEAIQFVKDISRELIGQRASSKRLQNGESLNI